MDIEGSEYEVLLSTPPAAFARIRRVNLEYHKPPSSGLDPQMSEGCLIQGLHALAGDGDADAANLEQRHGAKIDIATSRNFACRAHLARAQACHAERCPERCDPFGPGTAAKPNRDKKQRIASTSETLRNV